MNYSDFFDGLVQMKVIDKSLDGNFNINKNYYNSSIAHWKDIIKFFPNESPFNIFNYCFIYEIQQRVGCDIVDDELSKYTDLLIRIFIKSGIYNKLFGDKWKKELDIDP